VTSLDLYSNNNDENAKLLKYNGMFLQIEVFPDLQIILPDE